MNSNRIAWVDNIKMFAMLSVMIGHCSATFFTGEPFKDEIHTLLISYSMPLFIFISGFTSFTGIFRIDTFAKLIDYWHKLCLRIAIPSIVYTCFDLISRFINDTHQVKGLYLAVIVLICICVFIKIIKEQIITHKLKNLLLVIILFFHSCLNLLANLWFFPFLLRILILSSIIFFVYNRIYSKNRLFLGSITLYIIMALWNFAWEVNIELTSYFILGLFLKHNYYNDVYGRHINKFILVLLMFGACFFTIMVHQKCFYNYPFTRLVDNGDTYIWLYRQSAGMMWCLFFIGVSTTLPNTYNFFSYLGSKTLAIYGIHIVLINLLHGWGGIEIKYWWIWSIVLIFTIFILLLPTIVVIKIANQSWISRQLFLGEK